MAPTELFHPATRSWFEQRFASSTPVQTRGWPVIASGAHTLMVAPTGSGKTLAAFLWGLDRVIHEDGPPGVRVLYVSPLKALVRDIERNLRDPLAGIQPPGRPQVRVSVRTGDTSQRDRRGLLRDPGQVLVTTPESLFLLLGSRAREVLRTVHTIIVDELHAFAGGKRGVHLALSLERLCAITRAEPQRIGLSATLRPLEPAAAFLGGDRPVQIVDAAEPVAMDLRVVVRVPDMDHPPAPRIIGPAREPLSSPGMDRAGNWPAIHEGVLDLVLAHRSTLVFVNSRRLAERMATRLAELARERGVEGEVVRAHHGSLSHARRAETEALLQRGALRCVVATASLELGIDMGLIDRVVLVESPGTVSSGLQRVGRAGHGVGQRSVARLYPKHKGDLIEMAAVVAGMRAGEVEPLRIPRNALDVLAQQVVAMCVVAPRTREQLAGLVRRAAPYRELPDEALDAVLDLLSGRWRPELPELPVHLDRDGELFTARPGARLAMLGGAGTIPDRGLYPVFVAGAGPGRRIGELDEEQVHESRTGDTLLLGATTWRVSTIRRDRVEVVPAPDEVGRMPFWKGEGPGRPRGIGRRMGWILREVAAREAADARAWLARSCALDPLAAQNLVDRVAAQAEAGGRVPTDTELVVERTRDELGDWRICLLAPLGRAVLAPWALALDARLGADRDLQFQWSDDGIVLRLAEGDPLVEPGALFPPPEEVEGLVIERMRGSSLVAARFREAAARSLLFRRRRPNERTPLWLQRMKARSLMEGAASIPRFPVALEAWREVMQEVFDLDALRAVLADVRARRLRVVEVTPDAPTPFARDLLFRYVDTVLYEDDLPPAERRAAALGLDRGVLRALLGEGQARELFEQAGVAEVIAEVEGALQRTQAGRRAGSAGRLLDLLRDVGDLDAAELSARADGPVADWLGVHERADRVRRIIIAGEPRWIAREDAGRFDVLLNPAAESTISVEPLVRRYVRTRGPFRPEQLAARWGLGVGVAQALLAPLVREGELLRPAWGDPTTWCERGVHARIKARLLARLRARIAPVGGPSLARALAPWQGIGRSLPLADVVLSLEGMALPLADLETRILPSRVQAWRPDQLDRACASGELCWVGRGNRVVLVRRERVSLLLSAPTAEPSDPLQRAVLATLDQRGACFVSELRLGSTAAVGAALLALARAGLVTNDTFAPLRSGRPGGRWSTVRSLFTDEPNATAIAVARAQALLERYGLACPAAARAQGWSFSRLYPVLRAMEDSGALRAGAFVDGLGSVQFARAGMVESLRDPPPMGSRVLACADPANPYGALIPWPSGAPRRAAGVVLVLVEGAPALSVEGRSLRCLSDDPQVITRAARTLAGDRLRKRDLRIARVDEQAPAGSALLSALISGGFQHEETGLLLSISL